MKRISMILCLFMLAFLLSACLKDIQEYENLQKYSSGCQITRNLSRLTADKNNVYFISGHAIIKADPLCVTKTTLIDSISGYLFQIEKHDRFLYYISRGEGLFRFNLDNQENIKIYSGDITEYFLYNDEIYFCENLLAEKDEFYLCRINIDGSNYSQLKNLVDSKESDIYKMTGGLLGIYQDELYCYDILSLDNNDEKIQYLKIDSKKQMTALEGKDNYFTALNEQLSSIHENAVYMNKKVFYINAVEKKAQEYELYCFDMEKKNESFVSKVHGNDIYYFHEKLYIMDVDDNIEVLELKYP